MNPRAGYIQARVQTRFGALPDEALWRRLEPVRDLAGYLVEARGTALGPWVLGLTPASGPAEIEQLVTQRLAALIDECAAWLGPDWGKALDWLRLLPRLPELEAARRDGDPTKDPTTRCLNTPAAHEAGLANAWVAQWRRRLPRLGRRESGALEWLVSAVARHWAGFAQVRARDAWVERLELEGRLRALFRRTPLQPAAVFCLLALTALQLERLRAALLLRALFPGPSRAGD